MSEITEYPSKVTPDDGDLLVIEDSVSNSTKKITRSDFLSVPSDTTVVATTSLLHPATKKTYVTDLATNITLSTLDVALQVAETVFSVHLKDNGSPRSISYDGSWGGIGVTLPTVTTANKELYIMGSYNADTSKVDVLSIGRAV